MDQSQPCRCSNFKSGDGFILCGEVIRTTCWLLSCDVCGDEFCYWNCTTRLEEEVTCELVLFKGGPKLIRMHDRKNISGADLDSLHQFFLHHSFIIFFLS